LKRFIQRMRDRRSEAEPFPNRQSLPHHVPPWVGTGSLYFVTICCVTRRKNHLCRPSVAAQIFDSVAYRQREAQWFVRLLLLMPDHLHMLVTFPPTAKFVATIRLWKGYLARQHGLRWQKDFFEHRVRNAELLQSTVDYIRQNPVRAGMISKAEMWPYIWEAL
jgi:REP element-mobilizing transposase RayT